MTTTVAQPRLDGRAAALMVFLCALWGMQQVSVKVAVTGGMPPLLQGAIRSLIAFLLVIAWTGLREGPRGLALLLRVDRSLRPGLILGGLFSGEFAILYPGLALTTAARGVLFLYTAPFLTALAAHLLLPGERLTRMRGLGLAIAFGGVAIAFADGLFVGGGSLAGDTLCLTAALLWAASTIQIKRSPALGRARAAKVLLYQLGVSAPVLLVLSALVGEWRHPLAPSTLALLCLAYQSVIVAFASYLAWFWLVLRYPAGRLAPFTFLTPVFGIAFGGLLLGEPIGAALLAGAAAVAVGLRLLNRRA